MDVHNPVSTAAGDLVCYYGVEAAPAADDGMRLHRRAYWLADERRGAGVALVQYRKLPDSASQRKTARPRPRAAEQPAAVRPRTAALAASTASTVSTVATRIAYMEAALAARQQRVAVFHAAAAAAAETARAAAAAEAAAAAARAARAQAAGECRMWALSAAASAAASSAAASPVVEPAPPSWSPLANLNRMMRAAVAQRDARLMPPPPPPRAVAV